MGREVSATVRALLRCARQVSSEPPRLGQSAWPAAAGENLLCFTYRRGAHRGVRSASSGWTSSVVGPTTDRCRSVDPDPATPFALRGSQHVIFRRMSGRGRRGGGDDVVSRDAPSHRVNDQITARQIRLVSDRPNETSDETDETDSNDTKSTHEIVSTLVALRRAKLAGLDLVEVNARADPPVCRLMRYDSFRYAQRQKEKDGKRKAMERRRADTVKELKLTARISANDLRVKADKAVRFLNAGHRVTLRVEFKTNDGVKQSLRPKAGAVLFDEFRGVLSDEFEKAHVVAQEGKMVGPNHMTITLAPEKERGEGKRKGKTREEKKSAREADTGIQSRAVSSGDKNDKVDPEASSEDEELRFADPASALAEAAAQGDVVRALKARRGAGDDAVEQKDVDDAVARLLRLKARAESLRGDSRDSRARKTSVAPSGAASAPAARGFASFSKSAGASARFSSRPFGSSACALYSQSAHGRAGERVGAAKARARSRAAKKEAQRKENVVSRAAKELVASDDADASSSSLTALSPTRDGESAELSRDFNADFNSASPVSWSDPSSFRLGSEAEEHIKYEREKARVAAVLETRRLERLRAQERIDARANKSSSGPSFSGSFGSSSDSSSDDGSHQGAWAGAAAAATLAAAVAATLAATAEAEWTLFPRQKRGDTDDDSPDETKHADGGGGDAKTFSFYKKKKTATHPALDAAVAFAGGAGVVVSALGWPPGR